MDNIVNVAQISVAVMQFSVAAALAAAFSAWAAKHQERSNVEEIKVYHGGCNRRTRS